MSRRRILILSAAALLLLFLAWLLRGLVYNILVIPAQFILYYVRVLYITTPHTLLWVAFVALAYLALLNSLYRRPSTTELPHLPSPHFAELRISQLARYIGGRRRAFYRHRLKFVLTELAVQVIVQKKRITIQEARNLIDQGKLDVPADIGAYFKEGLLPWTYSAVQTPGLLLRLFQFFRKENGSDDISMKVLEYIEEQMEIERNGNSQSL